MLKMTEERLQEIEGIRNTAMADIPATATDPTSAVDRGYHRRKARAYGYTARIVVPELIQAVREQETRIEELQKVVDAAREYRTAKTVYAIHRVECIECQEELDCSAGEQLWRQELDTATRFCGALNVYDAYVAALDTKWQKRRGKSTHPQEGVSGNE